MYSKESMGLRMEVSGPPDLTGYSCKNVPFRTSESPLLRKEEIRPNIRLQLN